MSEQPSKKMLREERLAAKLRENLRRRKAQGKAQGKAQSHELSDPDAQEGETMLPKDDSKS